MKPSNAEPIKKHKAEIAAKRKKDPRLIAWVLGKVKKLKQDDPNVYPLY